MFRSRRYRVDNENVVLVLTILLVLGVVVITSVATVCVSGVFILGMFVISAMMIRSHHQSLIRQTLTINDSNTPELSSLVIECGAKLQPGPVDAFVAGKNEMNAYTFGLSSPKALVLYKPLLRVMNAGELKFIIGHEMGHVALGHTWLNTIVGGLAGIPAPFGAAVILYAAFRWWNRMCELSADRAGLLACGNLNSAVSAMVKLVAPGVSSQAEFNRALSMIDAEDDQASNRMAEVFQTHPMIIRRINKLREYVRTVEYQQMQAGVNSNVGGTTKTSAPRASAQEVQPIKPAVEEKPELSAEERWPWLKPKDKS